MRLTAYILSLLLCIAPFATANAYSMLQPAEAGVIAPTEHSGGMPCHGQTEEQNTNPSVNCHDCGQTECNSSHCHHCANGLFGILEETLPATQNIKDRASGHLNLSSYSLDLPPDSPPPIS